MAKNKEFTPIDIGQGIIDRFIGILKGFIITFCILAINNIIYVLFNVNISNVNLIFVIITIYGIIMNIYYYDKFTFFYVIGWIISVFVVYKIEWIDLNSAIIAILIPTIIWIIKYIIKINKKK